MRKIKAERRAKPEDASGVSALAQDDGGRSRTRRIRWQLHQSHPQGPHTNTEQRRRIGWLGKSVCGRVCASGRTVPVPSRGRMDTRPNSTLRLVHLPACSLQPPLPCRSEGSAAILQGPPRHRCSPPQRSEILPHPRVPGQS